MYCLHAEHVSIVQPRSHIRRSSGATQSIEITFAPRHPQSTPQHNVTPILDTHWHCLLSALVTGILLQSKITHLSLHALRSTVDAAARLGEGHHDASWRCLGDEDWDPEEEGIIAGLIGHGEDVLQLKTPTRLPSPLGGERAFGVAASRCFSLALSADGSVWSWGCATGRASWDTATMTTGVQLTCPPPRSRRRSGWAAAWSTRRSRRRARPSAGAAAGSAAR